MKQGFARSQSRDPCLYFSKIYADGMSTDISVYVDDLFIATDAGAEADLDIKALNLKFTMTVRENPTDFLRMNITYIRRGVIRLTCSTYVRTHTTGKPLPRRRAAESQVHPECTTTLSSGCTRRLSTVRSPPRPCC